MLKIIVLLLGLEPCAYEDDINCYWDAQTMGNGQGQSFISIHLSIM